MVVRPLIGVRELMIILRYLAFIATVLLICFGGYFQWKYAKANYPESWRWKSLLFINGFATCGIGTACFLPFSGVTWVEGLLGCLGGGLFGGYVFLTQFPQKVQTIIPKHKRE